VVFNTKRSIEGLQDGVYVLEYFNADFNVVGFVFVAGKDTKLIDTGTVVHELSTRR
jgi:hypothetical protein